MIELATTERRERCRTPVAPKGRGLDSNSIAATSPRTPVLVIRQTHLMNVKIFGRLEERISQIVPLLIHLRHAF